VEVKPEQLRKRRGRKQQQMVAGWLAVTDQCLPVLLNCYYNIHILQVSYGHAQVTFLTFIHLLVWTVQLFRSYCISSSLLLYPTIVFKEDREEGRKERRREGRKEGRKEGRP